MLEQKLTEDQLALSIEILSSQLNHDPHLEEKIKELTEQNRILLYEIINFRLELMFTREELASIKYH